MTAVQLTLAGELGEGAGDLAEQRVAWWVQAEIAVHRRARTGKPFTAYDLVSEEGVGEPPNPSADWGALFSAMRGAGVVRHAGFVRSSRPTVRGSACSLWVGALEGEAA